MQVVQKRSVRHQSSEGASFQRCWMRPLAGLQWANIHPLHHSSPPNHAVAPSSVKLTWDPRSTGKVVTGMAATSTVAKNLMAPRPLRESWAGLVRRAYFSGHQEATPQGICRCGPHVKTVSVLNRELPERFSDLAVCHFRLIIYPSGCFKGCWAFNSSSKSDY